MFKLEIKNTGSAFEDPRAEIARLLREVADQIEDEGKDDGVLRDINGNRCGSWLAEIGENDPNYVEPKWNSLTDEQKEALIAWYNVREEDMDDEDRERLATLIEEGKFEFWDCPNCEEGPQCEGRPDRWTDFQGVRQIDLTSYPAQSEEALRWCDSCRMHHQKPR